MAFVAPDTSPRGADISGKKMLRWIELNVNERTKNVDEGGKGDVGSGSRNEEIGVGNHLTMWEKVIAICSLLL